MNLPLRHPSAPNSRRRFLGAGTIAAAGALAATVGGSMPTARADTPEKPSVAVDVTAFGAVGDGETDATDAFRAAIAAAADVRGRVVVPAGTYLIDSLTLPDHVRLEGLGSDISRYGAATSGGVNLVHARGATDPLLTIDGGGVSVERICLQGGGSSALLLRVANGFESRLDRVQLAGVAGTALRVDRVNNNLWTDLFVNNCGSPSAAAVVVKSPTSGTNSNTFTCVDLTIEGSPGPALDLGYGTTSDYFVEFVRLIAPHIEALQTGENPEGIVRIGNVRHVELVAPVIYGGPGPLLVHDERVTRGIELSGGIRVHGGALLGVDSAKTGRPSPVLVQLLRGEDVAFVGTRFGRFTEAGIRIAKNYGSRVSIDTGCRIQNWGGSLAVDDLRVGVPAYSWRWGAGLDVAGPIAAGGSVEVAGDLTAAGHLVASTGETPTITALAALGTPSAAPTVTGTDTAGRITVTAGAVPTVGALARITFAKAYAAPPIVVATAGSASGGVASIAAVSVSSTAKSFDIGVSSALAAMATATFSYIVVG